MVDQIDFSMFHDILILNDDDSFQSMDEPYYRWKEIAPDTWAIQSDGCISYLLAGENEAILIDTGYGAGNIREYCEAICKKPVRKVANTHDHFDHTALNGLFDCAYMAEACLPLATVPFPSFEKGNFPRDYRKIPVKDGDEINVGGRVLKAFLIPCHSIGDIAYLDKQSRILFSGDVISKMDLRISGSVKNMYNNMKKLSDESENYDLIYGGHDMAISGKIIEKYEQNIRHILDGNEGSKMGEKIFPKKDLSKINLPEGVRVYERDRPRPEDMNHGKPEWEYKRLMEYAGCKVEYDVRFV